MSKAAGSLPAAFACVCVLSFENGKEAVEELRQPAERAKAFILFLPSVQLLCMICFELFDPEHTPPEVDDCTEYMTQPLQVIPVAVAAVARGCGGRIGAGIRCGFSRLLRIDLRLRLPDCI